MEPVPYISQVKRTCAKCKNEILSYLDYKAAAVVCPECGRVNEFVEGKPVGNASGAHKNTKNTALSIGTKGEIKGIHYVVTGCAYKKENGTSYFWHEYILYNPVSGIAFLTLYNGHWNYLQELKTEPTVKMGALYLDDEEYNLYSKYSIRIKEADGEFPYRISQVDDVRVREFINPPYMLSSEKLKEELTWFKGEYIKPEEIKNGFNLPAVPKRSGVGSIQPHSNNIKKGPFINLLVILSVIWFLLQLLFSNNAKEETVFSNGYEITDSMSGKDIYTSSFDLKDGTKNVEIKMSCNVSNSWEYTAFTLVNEKTGDIYDLDMEVEYYSGFEGGESWSEGSNDVYKFISSVPEGRYHLIIHPEKPASDLPLNLNIWVVRDVYMASNGFVMLLCFALYPIFYFLRRYWFERRRWNSSDYSPYDIE